MAVKESDESVAKELQPDIVLMDRYQGELRELDKKIATQSGMLMGGGELINRLENYLVWIKKKMKKNSYEIFNFITCDFCVFLF